MDRENDKVKSLFAVDGHNLIYRAAYGFPAKIVDDAGEDRTVVFAFLAMYRKSLGTFISSSKMKTPLNVVCFDGENNKASRTSIVEDYKKGRPETEPIMAALPEIKKCLEYYDINWVEEDEVEADDLIASICLCFKTTVIGIESRDKDFYQHINSNTYVVGQKGLITEETIRSKYGVGPERWNEYRAIVGDPADNLPGVKGVGPKSASQLLSQGSLDDIIEGKFDSSPSLRAKIIAARHEIKKTYSALLPQIKTLPPLGKSNTEQLPTAREWMRLAGVWD